MENRESRSVWSLVSDPRFWLAGAMGFASGLPILLSITVLQAWLTEEGVSLSTIGVFGLVALPYNLKFLWAPIVDRFNPLRLGRRRSWLVILQLCLAASIAVLGTLHPAQAIWSVAVAAVLITFFSATQDVVIDAYRRETMSDDEQGIAASFYVYGYSFGTLLASAGGLMLAGTIGFDGVYLFMATTMLTMVVISMLAPEPPISADRPANLRMAFSGPFIEFLGRYKNASVALVLPLFVFAYNLGNHLSGHMAIPFYLATGFSNTDIGAVSAVFGTAFFLLGTFIGGWLQLRIGLYRTLLHATVLKIVAIAGYILLELTGAQLFWLSVTMGFQNLTLGIGIAALMALIANITNPRFTATQFALFTALAALPRATLTAPTGWMALEMGWTAFFAACLLLAVPGLVLLSVCRSVIQQAITDRG